MRRAVALAASARRRTAPNPWVGAVVVRDGEIVGEGATEPPGGRHAEISALAQAGPEARGATVVVTLEPCSHRGRTPPCVDALVTAGVSRVVVAVEDPDPRVRGEGIAQLRAAGVDVVVGPGNAAVQRSLAPYLHHRRTGRAWCVLKTATSLDGRTAAADGSSRWITGPQARADAHGLRADSQAVVIGAGTALADHPSLTVRDAPGPVGPAPLRVLLDASGRVPATGPLFDTELAPTLVVTSDTADPAAVDAWRAAGAKVEVVARAGDGPGVDLPATLALLGSMGVLQALFEGGAHLHGRLLAAGVVDRVVQYVGPTLLGERGQPAMAWTGPDSIEDAPRFHLASITRLGDDARLDLEPIAAEAC